MILADVNTLVYAFRSQTTFHQLARDALTTYRDRGDLIVLTEVAVSFIRIATDKRLSIQPDEPADAINFIDVLTAEARFIREPRIGRWRLYRALGDHVDIGGSLGPDALLAATSLDLGAAILTADRDFLRFPGVHVHLLTAKGIVDHTVT